MPTKFNMRSRNWDMTVAGGAVGAGSRGIKKYCTNVNFSVLINSSMVNIREMWVRGYRNSMYHFYNFSIILKNSKKFL